MVVVHHRSIDYAIGVAVDASGSAYLTGTTNSFGAGDFDIFFVKFSPTGNLVWQVTWGGSGGDQSGGATADSSGGVIISGGGGLAGVSFCTPTGELTTPSVSLTAPAGQVVTTAYSAMPASEQSIRQ